jgi:hypothetical protein
MEKLSIVWAQIAVGKTETAVSNTTDLEGDHLEDQSPDTDDVVLGGVVPRGQLLEVDTAKSDYNFLSG